jgi:hypothetical protein
VTSPRVNTDSLNAVYGDGAMSYDELWHPVIRPPALDDRAYDEPPILQPALRAVTTQVAAPRRTPSPW